MHLNTDSPITIGIADDNPIFLEGLSTSISSYKPFSIVIQTDDCDTLIQTIDGMNRPPDICIIDIGMTDSYTALKEIKSKWPEVKVLILSGLKSELSIIRTIKIGANGYLLKGCNPEELHKALVSIYERGTYYSDIMQGYESTTRQSILTRLSYPEMEFLSLCCTELSMKGIAEKMNMKVRTIENYYETLCEKLKVENRIGLVLFALNIGLLPDSHPGS